MMSATYVYHRLSPGPNIRVLQLQPSLDFAAPIEVSFTEVSLAGAGKDTYDYEAISYVWGAPRGDQEIYCEGKTVLVTPNCLSALRHFRRKDRVRTLWCDAICIDQNTTEEKNHQVKIMGEVYKSASRVLVWLGEGEARFGPMVRLLRWHGLAWELLSRRRWLEDRLWVPSIGQGTAQDDVILHMSKFSVGLAHSVRNFAPFVSNNPWFSRAWTFQEFLLAPHVCLCVGFHWIPWRFFYFLYYLLLRDSSGADDLELHNLTATTRCHDLFLSLRQSLHGAEITESFEEISLGAILEIIKQSNIRRASDDKDSIYALYSVLREVGLSLPDPEYRSATETVFADFTRAIIHETSSLDLIALLQPQDPKARPGLPSWVPDYANTVNDPQRPVETYPVYSLCIYSSPGGEAGRLRVLGKKIATVHHSLGPEQHSRTQTTSLGLSRQHWEALATLKRLDETGEDRDTIASAMAPPEKPPPYYCSPLSLRTLFR
jgi:hypothetical protein